jgi:Lrp/AsnC family leucine-responsive transcriptional regulator
MVDALDLKIIEKLKINSRVSYVDIEKTNWSSSVRERIQN